MGALLGMLMFRPKSKPTHLCSEISLKFYHFQSKEGNGFESLQQHVVKVS